MAECDQSRNNVRLLAIIGPTASGKSALAAQLARRFSGEVVSCDSMQIYRGFSIATAVPTEEEMLGVPHHMLSFADASQGFSVAQYCTMARECIESIAAAGRLPVLCGGTGLYYSSLVDGIEFADFAGDDELRSQLNLRAQSEGGESLLAELTGFDPECAARLEPGDHKRIVRAIEVYRCTGITMTEHIRASRGRKPQYDLCAIGLGFLDREVLYERINRRVDIMLENGLIEEARLFFASAPGATSVQAIGYKELRPYLDGECTLEAAVERLKQATRRYAKRQLSWFRRDERINWLYVDDYSSSEELLSNAAATAERVLYGTENKN